MTPPDPHSPQRTELPRLVAAPYDTVPPRRPGSVRRTSHLLMTWPDGHGSDLRVSGRARDLLTPRRGPARIVATADVSVIQSPDREIRSIEVTPPVAPVEVLVGSGPGRGFRRAITAAFAGEQQQHSLGFFLIEDLPTASLISTFAWSRQPDMVDTFFDDSRRSASQVAGICSGYRPGGIALELRSKGADVSQNVAVTPGLDPAGDPLAWHDLEVPAGAAMCRRRRMDVWGDDGEYRVDAMFRDNSWDPDGREAIVHEYGLTATVDPSTSTLVALEATPRVLPYPECPLAANEIQRCLGISVTTLRSTVLEELRGIESCTHLNDMLRALAELPTMLAHLGGDPSPSSPMED